MEFDHLFICVPAPASEGDLLVQFGLTEGSSNQHPGQGTANRRFFFQNSFIELLYATNEEELSSALTVPTLLHERLLSKTDDTSPFGVCFRPADDGQDVPFDSWSYKPQYLPVELTVDVANAPADEPMWFYLSFGAPPGVSSADKGKPTDHKCRFKNITSVKISAPARGEYSDAANAANRVLNVAYVKGEKHLLEIAFDNEMTGNMKDFRPELPLIFRW